MCRVAHPCTPHYLPTAAVVGVAGAPLSGDLQRQRLLEGKNALDPTWSSMCLFNWVNTTHPCVGDESQWRGVQCNKGVVTSLHLESCGLDGTLPGSWGALPGLEGLRGIVMSRNWLKGSLPASWGRLSRLQGINLSVNRLTGPLPNSWAKLRRLQGLELPGNFITGTLPNSWGGLQQLDYLGLNENRLTGPLPASWGNMTGLHRLELQSNKLFGTLPASWGGLGRLTRLYLFQNRLTGPLPTTWGGLARMEELDMGQNQLTGTLPASWGGLTHLRRLLLGDNAGVNGTIPCSWKTMGTNSTSWPGREGGRLRSLSLGGTRVLPCCPSVELKQAWDYSVAGGSVARVRGE